MNVVHHNLTEPFFDLREQWQKHRKEFDNRHMHRSIRLRVSRARTTRYLHVFILAEIHKYNQIMAMTRF